MFVFDAKFSLIGGPIPIPLVSLIPRVVDGEPDLLGQSVITHVPCSFHCSIVVAPGHYGQLLNVWERPRGIYPISMAMLELLLNETPPSNSIATVDRLACVVFVMREVFAGCHKWRYRSSTQRDEMGMMSFILLFRAWE